MKCQLVKQNIVGNWLIFHVDWHLDKNKDNPNVTASTGGNQGEISLESQNSNLEGIINYTVHFFHFYTDISYRVISVLI